MILNTESLPGSPGGLNETSLPAESAKRTAVQPMAACAAILLLLLTGCQAKHMEISKRPMGFCQAEIMISGRTRGQVLQYFGEPAEKEYRRFRKPFYGFPESVRSVDEQWIYYPGGLRHVFIYFCKGRVVLAVEEWSDL